MIPAKLMRFTAIALLLCALAFVTVCCQTPETFTCEHNNLSDDYSFNVAAVHHFMEDGVSDSLDVHILVTNKHTNAQQPIHIGSGWMFEGTYTDCSRVRSYTTGVNKDADIMDNDYGDIVVADLNFDNKDDFAIKVNSGGNTGPDYTFYIQSEGGAFKQDRFLTDSVGYFPAAIDVVKKQITTSCIAGAWGMSDKLFRYNTQTNTWKIYRHYIWQDVEFTTLSDVFNFTVSVSEIRKTDQDSVYVAVAIMDKKGRQKQEIKLGSSFFEQPFSDQNLMRSYTTGFNKNAQVADLDYGSLVVADFNFDGKEDLAIKREQGGNGGPLYNFYIQNENTLFKKDGFLSATAGYFPVVIDAQQKRLIFKCRLNTYEYEQTTYKYNAVNKRWVLLNKVTVTD